MVATNSLFDVFSGRYEQGSIVVAANRRVLDRLTHHVHILEMNGDSYRLSGSRR